MNFVLTIEINKDPQAFEELYQKLMKVYDQRMEFFGDHPRTPTPEIKGYKHIHSRRSGSKRLIDLHIILDGELRLKQAHSICDEIEDEIKSMFSPCEVTIHPEPFSGP